MKCTNCGQGLPSAAKFCPNCGMAAQNSLPADEKPLRQPASASESGAAVRSVAPPPPPKSTPPPPTPHASAPVPPPYRLGQNIQSQKRTKRDSRRHKNELGVGGYLGSLLLLFLPAIGLLFAIVWSVVPGINPGRRSLSRAFLLFLLLVFVLCALCLLFLSLFAPQTYNALTTPLLQFFSAIF